MYELCSHQAILIFMQNGSRCNETYASVSVANPTISKAGKAKLEVRGPTFVLSKLLTCLVPELGYGSHHQMQWIDWHSLAPCCGHTFGALNIKVSTAHLGLLAENGKPSSCHRPALPSAVPIPEVKPVQCAGL
jgi:hypothetical protein